jgi:predicted lactoylglutathione lyase
LPLNGDWSNKYSVADNTKFGLAAGGDFGFNFNDNFNQGKSHSITMSQEQCAYLLANSFFLYFSRTL